MARKRGVSATQRTLKELRRLGYTCGIVEKTIPKTWIKQDLFGFIDIIAMHPGGVINSVGKILAVQSTTRANHGAHVRKIMDNENIAEAVQCWLQCGGFFEIWSWAKVGPRGKAKKWQVSRQSFSREDFA